MSGALTIATEARLPARTGHTYHRYLPGGSVFGGVGLLGLSGISIAGCRVDPAYARTLPWYTSTSYDVAPLTGAHAKRTEGPDEWERAATGGRRVAAATLSARDPVCEDPVRWENGADVAAM